MQLLNRKKTLALSLAGSAAVMLFFRFLMVPVFETNDDMAIMGIVNGSRGTFDIHVIQNFVLGLLYRSLYRITARISWYSVCQYGFLMLSFAAVCYVLIRRAGSNAGIGLWLILVSFFAPQCYGMMQYTKAAGILTCSGLFLMLHGVECRQRCGVAGDAAAGSFAGRSDRAGTWARVEILCGALLALCGAMYRFDEFLSAGAVMTGIALLLLMTGHFTGEGVRAGLVRFIGMALPFALLLAAAFCLRTADQRLYESDPRWSYYREYNDLRAQLQDYGFPDYEENRSAYEALGINEDAFDLYTGWNQFDPDKLDVETMRALVALKPTRSLDRELIKDYFSEMPRFYVNNRMCRCFLMLVAVMLFSVFASRKRDPGRMWAVFTAFVWQIAVFGLLYFYLFYKGRYTMDRIAVGYWFAMILFTVWVITGQKDVPFEESRQRIVLLLAALSFGFYSSYWLDATAFSREGILRVRERQQRILRELSEDKEHLYLRKAGLLVMDDCFGPFDAPDFGLCDNQGLLGGWICSAPAQLDVLERYGVTNPYRDMIDNDRVLLVDNHVDETLRYLRAYYAPEAEAVEIRRYGAMRVYQIVTEKHGEDDGASSVRDASGPDGPDGTL